MSEREIKIGGITYQLEFVDAYALDGAYGRCDLGDSVISINRQTSAQQQASTILHEVIEALNYHNELGLEHRQIMTLEHGLHQVLVDNEDLLLVPVAGSAS